MTEFTEWLMKELKKREWAQIELTRRGGISSGAISKVLSGERKPGTEMLTSIAHALGLPVQTVYRAAGLLPPEPEYVPLLDEWNAVFYELDDDERQEILDIARLKVSRHKSGKTPPKSSSRIKKTPARSASGAK